MIDFDETSTRRLPVYLVLDVSGSMAGDSIEAVNQGVRLILEELRNDPMALETAWLSCITFSDTATELLPLTEVGSAFVPHLSAGGLTNLGAALRMLLDKLKTEIRPNTPQQKGDYKPMVFLLSDGQPTDHEWPLAADELKEQAAGWTANIIALGCGSSTNTDPLKQITSSVLHMADMTPDNVRSFFKWVSQSVRVTSRSAAAAPASGGKVDLPALPSGIQVAL
jgi:uncharacterized protein YegL